VSGYIQPPEAILTSILIIYLQSDKITLWLGIGVIIN